MQARPRVVLFRNRCRVRSDPAKRFPIARAVRRFLLSRAPIAPDCQVNKARHSPPRTAAPTSRTIARRTRFLPRHSAHVPVSPCPCATLPRFARTLARSQRLAAVSYTHLRAHETPEHLVCRLLLEKKKKK